MHGRRAQACYLEERHRRRAVRTVVVAGAPRQGLERGGVSPGANLCRGDRERPGSGSRGMDRPLAGSANKGIFAGRGVGPTQRTGYDGGLPVASGGRHECRPAGGLRVAAYQGWVDSHSDIQYADPVEIAKIAGIAKIATICVARIFNFGNYPIMAILAIYFRYNPRSWPALRCSRKRQTSKSFAPVFSAGLIANSGVCRGVASAILTESLSQRSCCNRHAWPWSRSVISSFCGNFLPWNGWLGHGSRRCWLRGADWVTTAGHARFTRPQRP